MPAATLLAPVQATPVFSPKQRLSSHNATLNSKTARKTALCHWSTLPVDIILEVICTTPFTPWTFSAMFRTSKHICQILHNYELSIVQGIAKRQFPHVADAFPPSTFGLTTPCYAWLTMLQRRARVVNTLSTRIQDLPEGGSYPLRNQPERWRRITEAGLLMIYYLRDLPTHAAKVAWLDSLPLVSIVALEIALLLTTKLGEEFGRGIVNRQWVEGDLSAHSDICLVFGELVLVKGPEFAIRILDGERAMRRIGHDEAYVQTRPVPTRSKQSTNRDLHLENQTVQIKKAGNKVGSSEAQAQITPVDMSLSESVLEECQKDDDEEILETEYALSDPGHRRKFAAYNYTLDESSSSDEEDADDDDNDESCTTRTTHAQGFDYNSLFPDGDNSNNADVDNIANPGEEEPAVITNHVLCEAEAQHGNQDEGNFPESGSGSSSSSSSDRTSSSSSSPSPFPRRNLPPSEQVPATELLYRHWLTLDAYQMHGPHTVQLRTLTSHLGSAFCRLDGCERRFVTFRLWEVLARSKLWDMRDDEVVDVLSGVMEDVKPDTADQQ
ncbi:hypothetical protein L228DRAFT_235501 [Xylona heveae TC161]|uniref:F-box domain-containing protein n=1 Tax=Xylona heveae (strain CBS 132557 / TC161) TaxID=1328760 RepID=A0A165JMM6_XYLHT|nr:hypothetical protein L228DRAFT_235501 [Xylona heveae TC161]KZF26427.1 hypothetical protein L228DRAFT_235501 [Xylona heveae TC161]